MFLLLFPGSVSVACAQRVTHVSAAMKSLCTAFTAFLDESALPVYDLVAHEGRYSPFYSLLL